MINYFVDVFLCGAITLGELFLVFIVGTLIECGSCLFLKKSLLYTICKRLKKLDTKLNDYFEG